MTLNQLILYTSEGCHLCEQAEVILAEVLSDTPGWQLVKSEITDSPQLFDRYGIRIPVVRRTDTGDELGWPFDCMQLRDFLRLQGHQGSQA